MLTVRRDLCIGCGLCVESCPQQAISIISSVAQIDRDRCNQCYHCLDVCPQGAIKEVAPVSVYELRDIVAGLKHKSQDLITRIDRLKV